MAREATDRDVRRWNLIGDEFFSPEGFFRELGFPRDWGTPSRSPRLAPAVDVREDQKCFTVTAELPGVKREDVTIEVQDNVLSIRGEKKTEREDKKEKTHWVERSYGSFTRSFTLPPTAAIDDMKASFADGVLTIEIPKREEAQPRQIAIK